LNPGTQPEAGPGARPARGAWLRFGLLVVLLAVGFALLRWSPVAQYLDLDRAVSLLESLRSYPATPAIMIGVWTLAAPFGMPVSPLVFASAVVYGTIEGWIYSTIGAMAGGALTFLVARALGRDLVVHWLGALRVQQLEELLSRHGFWTAARIRFVPLPFAVANTGAALSGMRFSTFFFGTLVGVAPVLLIMSYFCHTVVYAAAAERGVMIRNLVLALLAFLALTFLPRLFMKGELTAQDGADGTADSEDGPSS
jgi:uncharacterized membrane protein YdjX (TVP38/TMEM64 family)